MILRTVKEATNSYTSIEPFRFAAMRNEKLRAVN